MVGVADLEITLIRLRGAQARGLVVLATATEEGHALSKPFFWLTSLPRARAAPGENVRNTTASVCSVQHSRVLTHVLLLEAGAPCPGCPVIAKNVAAYEIRAILSTRGMMMDRR